MLSIDTLNQSLPDKDFVFTLKIKGNISKLDWQGHFKGQIPTNGMRASIKRKEAILNAGLETEKRSCDLGLPYDSIIDFHKAVAYISVVLSEYPEWLEVTNFGVDLYDKNVVFEIYDKILAKENEWYEKIWGTEVESDSKDSE